MTSEITKAYRARMILCWILDFIVVVGPLVYFLIKGFIFGGVQQKFVLGACCGVAAVICLVNIFTKWHLRSPLWIVLLGVYYCLQKIELLLLLMAICAILDEFVFAPLYRYNKNKLSINKEIDKR